MLSFKIYHSTSFTASKTDVSSKIIDIENFGWERDRDYRHIISHPSLEIKDDLNISEDDYFFFEWDDEFVMVAYVESITPDAENFVNKVKLWDVIKKLDYTKIGEFQSSWFSSTSYWTVLTLEEQRRLYRDTTTPTDTHYISAIFLAQVMLNHIIGNIDFSAGQINNVKSTNSLYEFQSSSIAKGDILFNLDQMKAIGKTDSTDSNFKGKSCLDILNLILQLLQLRIQWNTVNNSPRWILNNLVPVAAPSADDDGYKPKTHKSFDVFKASLQKKAYSAYSGSWSDLDEYEEFYPDVSLEGKKVKSFTLPKNFEFHRLENHQNYGWKLNIFDVDFLTQFTELMSTYYINKYKEKVFTMKWDDELNIMKIKFNFNKITMDHTFYEVLT